MIIAKKGQLLSLLTLAFLLQSLSVEVLGQGRSSRRLTGTWNLDSSRSDDVRDATNRALGDRELNSDRWRQRLENRLQPPDRIAIQQSRNQITMSSPAAPQVTFTADGRARTEANANGRSVQTTASLNGPTLTVRTQGDRASDFQVTFEPIENGRSLRVMRRMYNDRLAQPIETRSFYTRVSDIAQLDGYNDPYRSVSPNRSNQRTNGYAIPPDTSVVATLNESLDTKTANDQDRFTMTLRSPSQYNGAVIDGYLTRVERSGRVTGTPEIGFEFESLRLRDGGTYDFSGYIESVHTLRGEKVTVDNEGSVKEKSGQTEKTVIRSGIGAAIGAIIGGLSGGGKGAAIGGAVGAGAGAGSVMIQGRDDLQLDSGTEFNIRTTSTSRISSNNLLR
jgi:hypothetical protein